VNITKTTYGELRKASGARYFVQWVTVTNRHGEIIIVGWCVRDTADSHWKTVFKNEDETVCRKVCGMLNEGEVTKC
jgi:hypothetical protein